MRDEFTAVIEKDGGWHIAYCPEIPGANAHGKTIEECKRSLAAAISLILEDPREDSLRIGKSSQRCDRGRAKTCRNP